MAWYRCTGGGSGSGAAETILSNGVISTDSSYATAVFNKSIVDDMGGIIIQLRDTVQGTDYVGYAYIKADEFPTAGNYITKNIPLHYGNNITVKIYQDKISGFQYSGSYYYIYADVVGFLDVLF